MTRQGLAKLLKRLDLDHPAALTKQLSTLETRATGFEEIETRLDTLRSAMTKVEETAQQLLSPDGELQKHRLDTAREERAALSTMLTQIDRQGSKLSALGKSMKEVSDLAGGTKGKMEASASATRRPGPWPISPRRRCPAS